jgi:primase-polymerase (primpol)-like protein
MNPSIPRRALSFIPEYYHNLEVIPVSNVVLHNIPDELKSLPQWVCWRKAERDGKTTKLPVNPHTGKLASTTDSSTWTTCTEACNAILRYGCDGVGFVFTSDDPYAGVDLDKCRDAETGVLEPWAQEIVETIQTFTEVSTSGTGVHCILRGRLPGARCRKGRTEMYDSERYFVMTGNCLAEFPLTIEERQSEIEALYAKVFQADTEREGVLTSKLRPEPTHQLTDDEIIEKACNARDGEKFRRLWEGDDSGYESRSEADAALCALLAFWTRHDPDWIDHLFRQSGLYRDKWERVRFRFFISQVGKFQSEILRKVRVLAHIS